MWLSDFRYAAEGADYASVLFSYPLLWWIGIFGMIGFGVLVLWKFPKWELHWARNTVAAVLAAAAVTGAVLLPEAVFLHDKTIRYAGSATL